MSYLLPASGFVLLPEDLLDQLGDDTRLVLVAGPSAAGKSRLARNLAARLGATHLSGDDWARDLADVTRLLGKRDYEPPAAYDIAGLSNTIAACLDGVEAHRPVYDFEQDRRVGYRVIERDSREQPLVVEFLHALAPEVLERLVRLSPLCVFVDAPRWLRLLRRLIRDVAERGAEVSEVLARWPQVLDGESRWIDRQRGAAAVTIDNRGGDSELMSIVRSLSRLKISQRDYDAHLSAALSALYGLDRQAA